MNGRTRAARSLGRGVCVTHGPPTFTTPTLTMPTRLAAEKVPSPSVFSNHEISSPPTLLAARSRSPSLSRSTAATHAPDKVLYGIEFWSGFKTWMPFGDEKSPAPSVFSYQNAWSSAPNTAIMSLSPSPSRSAAVTNLFGDFQMDRQEDATEQQRGCLATILPVTATRLPSFVGTVLNIGSVPQQRSGG